MRIPARHTDAPTLLTQPKKATTTGRVCGLAAVTLLLSMPVKAQQEPSANGPDQLGPIEAVGSEFQVNTYTTEAQRRPGVSKAPDGRFVVVWEDLRSGDLDIWAQLYASDGSPVGDEFQVNGFTSGSQQDPAVTMDPSGSFAVVWQGNGAADSTGIQGHLFFSDGTPNGGEFAVNTGTTMFTQQSPSIASDDDGDFVVVWRSGAVTAAQIFASDGSGFGEFVAHSDLDDSHPEVAMNGSGDFVVVWEGVTKGFGYPIEGQRFDSAGSAVGATFQVNTGGDYNYRPTVGLADSGSFVIAWNEAEKGGDYDIVARRFDSSGSPVASELQVNTTSGSYYSYSPNLGMKPGGDFAVVWQSYGMASPSILGQRFASDATPIGTEFAITSSTAAQFGPVLAVDEQNVFIVAWQSGDSKSDGDDGDESGIFAQRFNFCDDSDFDGVCNVDDVCEGSDDSVDTDMDGTPDGCDLCEGSDDSIDTDMDGTPDGCDLCEGSDDSIDTDMDGTPDGCDLCEGSDDSIDTDMDGTPDGCDLCEGSDDSVDTDMDGTPDGCDICEGSDDSIDTDMDGTPDGCDLCEGSDDSVDTDMDGTPDGCDICALGDDSQDGDMDGVPDACDICALGDDGVDSDKDTVPDACDVCPGGDDTVDTDMDNIPDDCDDFVPPVVSSVSALTADGAANLDGCRELRATTTGLSITFSEAMDTALASDSASFRLIAANGDFDIDTLTCGAVSPNDRLVPLTSIEYDEGSFTTTIEANIVEEHHRILVCGTVQDDQGNAMGSDFRAFFRVDTTNLFDNGHFDCLLSDWDEQGVGIGADSFDFHGTQLSGSAAFNVSEGGSQSISQCADIAPDGLGTATELDLTTGVFVSPKAAGDTVQVRRSCELFSAANCNGKVLGQVSTADQIVIDTEGTFLAFNDPMTFSAATASARCSFEYIGVTGDPITLFDEIVMTLPPSLADSIFIDGFESGDTSAWSETEFTLLSLAPKLSPAATEAPQ